MSTQQKKPIWAPPFDQKSGSSLIYFLYMHTTIRPNYMVLFHLFFLLSTTLRPRPRVLTDYFSYLHTTIRQNIWSSFIYSFFSARPFDQNLEFTLIYFLHLRTAIRPKMMVLINLFILFAHDHSTKNYDSLSFILSLVHDHSTKN